MKPTIKQLAASYETKRRVAIEAIDSFVGSPNPDCLPLAEVVEVVTSARMAWLGLRAEKRRGAEKRRAKARAKARKRPR
jgi:hypothetical protein